MIMVLLILLVIGCLLFKSTLINGKKVDCNSHNASLELKKVYFGGSFTLSVATDHDQAHVLVLQVASDGEPTPLMSVNADPNSVPNLTFWGNSEMDYANRTSVERTATKSGEAQDISFTFRPVEFGDGGIYSVEVENAHTRVIKCVLVYVLGSPTTPELMLIKGDCSSTEGSCARFSCISNSTTTPRNSEWPLTYSFSINGSSPDSESKSRYFVKNNELMIGGLTKADDNLRVTCDVQEENGHPRKVSSTVALHVLPSDASSRTGIVGRQNSDHDGTSAEIKGNDGLNMGLIAFIVVLIVLLIVSGTFNGFQWRKRYRKRHPSEMKWNQTGSSSMLEDTDESGAGLRMVR